MAPFASPVASIARRLVVPEALAVHAWRVDPWRRREVIVQGRSETPGLGYTPEPAVFLTMEPLSGGSVYVARGLDATHSLHRALACRQQARR